MRIVDVAIGVLAERRPEGWRILIARRPEGTVRGGWWEWPGGKIEAGETPEQCLIREFQEELALSIAVEAPLPVIEHQYDHAHVRIHAFFCWRTIHDPKVPGVGVPGANEPQNRLVAEHRWVAPEALGDYRFLEGNAPLVKHVIEVLGKRTEADATRRAWRALALVGLLALVVRVLYLVEIQRTPLSRMLMGDALSYDTWAREIAGGQWLGHGVFYQAPLYPYFLAVIYWIFGHSLPAVRLVQILLGSAACVMLARAGQLFMSRRAGLLAGVLLAVYPTAIFNDALIQKSVLDLFFLCLLLVLMGGAMQDVRGTARGSWLLWLAMGLVLGCLMLTRENAAVLAVVVGGWGIWDFGFDFGELSRTGISDLAPGNAPGQPGGRRLKECLAVLAMLVVGMALALGPVAVRNKVVGGEFCLTTSQFGPNFYIGNNAAADGKYRPLRAGRGSAQFERIDATDLAQRALGKSLTPAEVSSYWAGRAWSFMSRQPTAWLKLMWRKFVLLWNVVEIGDTEDQYSYAHYVPMLGWLGGVLNFGTIVPLALLGIAATRRRWRRLWPLYVMVLAYAGSVVAFYVFSRYRFPLVPLLLLLGAGVVEWEGWKMLSRKRRQGGGARERGHAAWVELAVGGAVAIAVGVWVNRPAASVTEMRAETENSIGVFLFQQGNPADAEAHFKEALRLKPDFVNAHSNLAGVLAQRGELAQASAEYQAAMQADPRVADTHYNFGLLLAAHGRPREAIQQFLVAEGLDPDDEKIHCSLAGVLGDTGQLPAALAEYQRALKLDPGDAAAYNGLGRVLAQQERLPEAAKQFALACRLKPDDLNALFNLGNALRLMGKYAQAAPVLEQALRLDPHDQGIRRMLDQVYKAQGRNKDAEAVGGK